MTTDTAAPRFTAEEMLYVAASHDIDGDEKTADMLRQAAADLAGAPTREELIKVLRDKVDPPITNGTDTTGFLERHAQRADKHCADQIDALIAAGVKVRHE